MIAQQKGSAFLSAFLLWVSSVHHFLVHG